MDELQRRAVSLGSDLARELAALRVRVQELEAERNRLYEERAAWLELKHTLLRSQATRSRSLQRARAREQALVRQLVEAGVLPRAPEAGPGKVGYLGQYRTAKSLLGP